MDNPNPRGYFKDKRGIIQDLLVGEDVDAVTYITFKAGARRGFHYHKKTTQHDFILTGKLKMFTDKGEKVVHAGELITHLPGSPHGYEALKYSQMITMTKGPRKGNDYSKDTYPWSN